MILNTLLEYALDHLLIAGQVENYILIINLDDAGLSDKEVYSFHYFSPFLRLYPLLRILIEVDYLLVIC